MTTETEPDAVALLVKYREDETHGSALAALDEIHRAILAERQRHAEEMARLERVLLGETRAVDDLRLKEIRDLRDQLRRLEGERDRLTDKAHERGDDWREAFERERSKHANTFADLTTLRALLPDVRACLEYCDEDDPEDESEGNRETVGVVARRILARLDELEGKGGGDG